MPARLIFEREVCTSNFLVSFLIAKGLQGVTAMLSDLQLDSISLSSSQ